MVAFIIDTATKIAMQMFVLGAGAAISVYSGTKLPKNRRNYV